MAEPRQLGPLNVLDVFVVGRITGPVRVSPDHPLVGELMQDVTGRYFLSPEEDERGYGMGCVSVVGLEDERAFDLVDQTVEVTGVYDPARGFLIESIARRRTR